MSLDSINKTDLSLFLKITKSINTRIDKDTFFEEVTEACKTLLKSESAAVFLLDKVRGELSFKYTDKQIPNFVREKRILLGEGVAGTVAESGKGIIINDPHDLQIYKDAEENDFTNTNSLLCLPMLLKGEVIGVLQVINHLEKQGYEESDEILLNLFSECAAIVINNRELFRSAALKVKQLSAIYRISRFVTYSTPSAEGLFGETTSIIKREFLTERISIILLDELTGEYKFVYGKNIPKQVLKQGSVTIKDNVLSEVKKSKAGVLCFNIEADSHFGINKKLRYRSKSFICVPLIYKKTVIGFISITERENPLSFDVADLDFMTTVANEFTQAYKLIELKQELEEKKAMDVEMDITVRLQQGILPETFPRFNGIDFAAERVSKNKVGGDFYDFLKLDKNRFFGLIGDISGKGIPSTVFMSICVSILKICLEEESSPKDVFYKANKHIYANSREGMFATAFLFKLDISSQKIVYSDAGHLEQYHYSFKNDVVRILDLKSKPLGVLADVKFQEKTVNYEKKDVLVLFTDGLLEPTNEKGEEFGEQRIIETIKKNHHLKAEGLKQKLLQAVKAFTGREEYDDDLTLLVIKFD